jgi:hypothetical protein
MDLPPEQPIEPSQLRPLPPNWIANTKAFSPYGLLVFRSESACFNRGRRALKQNGCRFTNQAGSRFGSVAGKQL